MCEIEDIRARQILDSRGNPTVEAEVILTDGTRGRASVPSGASTGIYEARELRDQNINEYRGKGVTKAVDNIHSIIAPNLIGEDASNQEIIDSLLVGLDGSFNKSVLGANAILAVSLACARASAEAREIPLYRYIGGINARILPAPMMNIINGGVHADNNLDFQEFMIVPAGTESFSEALRAGSEIFHTLETILKEKGISTTVGDEGGFAPNLSSARDAIELIIGAVEKAGYSTNTVKIALDIAASELYEEGECSGGVCSLSKYFLRGENKELTSEEMIDYIEKLIAEYPIISVEDGLSQDDWTGWQKLTARLGEKCLLVGDDLFVTNTSRLKDGIKNKAGNSILIKPNQIGTLSETLDSIMMAQQSGYRAIISHRSGETEDTFISDLAVASGCGIIKTGSLSRTDRLAKYNQLLRIEEELGEAAIFQGLKPFKI